VINELVLEISPGCNEHFILHNLRNSNDFIPELDFVAEKEGRIVGQIVYSRFGFRCAEKYDIKTADDKFAVALQTLELKQGVLNNMPGKFIESVAFAVKPSLEWV
jgi:predicted N-acetyltransferase YhbS